MTPGDLVVLAADKHIEFALRGLLSRHKALGIRSLKHVEYIVHPHRAPGIFHTGHELLAAYDQRCRYALVCLDRAWEGTLDDPLQLAEQIENRCKPRWEERVRCIVIDPEIEIWIWSDSPYVGRVLGWSSTDELREWLACRGLWTSGEKPQDPKKALTTALKEKRIAHSSSIFQKLAESVSLRKCKDPAFFRLVEVLRTWFPSEAG